MFRAENSDNAPTKVRILYDDEFNKHPEINSFNTNEVIYDLKKYNLHDFSDLVAKKEDVQNQNYLFIFLLTAHLTDNHKLIDEIRSIIGLFSSSYYLGLKTKPVESTLHFDFKRIEDGYRLIEFFTGKIFNNRELTFEEETIIKMLFPGKVIEVQPLKVDTPNMPRFVAKYSIIDSERKLHNERDKFNQFIRNTGVIGYSADYYDTDTHEAIMYNYASSDSKKDSFSFANLISDKILDQYSYDFTLKEVIDELFTCAPYQIWNSKKTENTFTIKSIYSDYLKSEAKILKVISQIKEIDESDVANEELIRSYKIIKDYSINTYRKICHGDLHSENFFKDEQGVYLIDFGWTNQHHSLIDHTTLECSLKFKHLPSYIPIADLVKCEETLLSIDSFSNSFDLSFIKRPSILEVYKLIVQIRDNSKQHMFNKLNPLEYLISLFIINFRQIQYSDLNQTYAIASAEILAKEIVKLIS